MREVEETHKREEWRKQRAAVVASAQALKATEHETDSLDGTTTTAEHPDDSAVDIVVERQSNRKNWGNDDVVPTSNQYEILADDVSSDVDTEEAKEASREKARLDRDEREIEEGEVDSEGDIYSESMDTQQTFDRKRSRERRQLANNSASESDAEMTTKRQTEEIVKTPRDNMSSVQLNAVRKRVEDNAHMFVPSHVVTYVLREMPPYEELKSFFQTHMNTYDQTKVNNAIAVMLRAYYAADSSRSGEYLKSFPDEILALYEGDYEVDDITEMCRHIMKTWQST